MKRNNLFARYGGGNNQRRFQNGGINRNMFNSMNDFINGFQDFSRKFQGNPEAVLQQKLNSGEISQDDYRMVYDLACKITGRQ